MPGVSRNKAHQNDTRVRAYCSSTTLVRNNNNTKNLLGGRGGFHSKSFGRIRTPTERFDPVHPLKLPPPPPASLARTNTPLTENEGKTNGYRCVGGAANYSYILLPSDFKIQITALKKGRLILERRGVCRQQPPQQFTHCFYFSIKQNTKQKTKPKATTPLGNQKLTASRASWTACAFASASPMVAAG